jgi:hypothetical protein
VRELTNSGHRSRCRTLAPDGPDAVRLLTDALQPDCTSGREIGSDE